MSHSFRIESLLAARLFLSPQLIRDGEGGRLFFLSDLSGRISLYAMNCGGSVPEPLLPPDIALQNPALMNGYSFYVFASLDKILVMIDRDGDENYQPCIVPLAGGIPELLLGERFAGQQVNLIHCDPERNLVALMVDPRTSPLNESFLVDLVSGQVTSLGTSLYGNWFDGHNDDYSRLILVDSSVVGDNVLYLWEQATGQRRLLYGRPLDERAEGEVVPLSALGNCQFTPGDRGLLCFTALFDDRYGLGYLALAAPQQVKPVDIVGIVHQGQGELENLKGLGHGRYLLKYNINGCSWAYEGTFDEEHLQVRIDRVVAGQGPLSNGVVQSLHHDKTSGDYALSFSTATLPAQIYTVEGREGKVVQHTRERILGIPQHYLSPGEDASYTSHDGLRISARLYLPAAELGFAEPRPVVFYIHGGPQSQEKPDFTWFSMPLIQFLTLNGFAVWVPNVRGSSGYGLAYVKQVDRDWGGQDRLDHVAAFEHLRRDPRLDMGRVAVTGRSYGGYMTLTLAGRHPELWTAACDMFGPYNLLTFLDRLPETWKTYFYLSIGHPERDREFMLERSPSSHLDRLACPLLVIQGANDPRVVLSESQGLVANLQAQDKEVELLVFANEGHDVIKFENKVRCYNAIVDFFIRYLQPDRQKTEAQVAA